MADDMIDDMYRFVRPARPKRNFALPVLIAVAVVTLLLIALLPIYSIWYQFHYRDFVSALSDSTVYASEHGSLHSTQEGQSVRMTSDHGYNLYGLLIDSPGRLRRAVPDQEADIYLDYGDGATLEIWEVELTDKAASQPEGILWRFVDPEGQVWIYDIDTVTYSRVSKFTDLFHNEEWAETFE